MNTTLNEKAEKIKSSIKGTAEKSKETIREIIVQNTLVTHWIPIKKSLIRSKKN
ncbi:MAG: hypothetical protein K8R85_02075 [Bacteroidetes bacterium]|nr:hypothetical protein [Bacteroidota bacterium]